MNVFFIWFVDHVETNGTEDNLNKVQTDKDVVISFNKISFQNPPIKINTQNPSKSNNVRNYGNVEQYGETPKNLYSLFCIDPYETNADGQNRKDCVDNPNGNQNTPRNRPVRATIRIPRPQTGSN